MVKKEQIVLTASVREKTEELVNKYHTEIVNSRIQTKQKPIVSRSRILEELIVIGLSKIRPAYFKGDNENFLKEIMSRCEI